MRRQLALVDSYYESDEEDEGEESDAEDLEEQIPNPFSDLVTNAPGSVTSLLKRYHKQKDDKRYELVEEIAFQCLSHAKYVPNDHLNAFVSAGLPMVLIEIAGEASLYKRWGQDYNATVKPIQSIVRLSNELIILPGT